MPFYFYLCEDFHKHYPALYPNLNQTYPPDPNSNPNLNPNLSPTFTQLFLF